MLLQSSRWHLLENGNLFLLESTPVVYSGPITITSGGTYTGNWKSTSPTVNAVTISTTSPVTITNSNIQGAGDLIRNGVGGINLTVTNTKGYGLNPGVSGYSPGRFIYAYQPSSIVASNNYMQGTAGINLVQGTGSVTVINNSFRNVDGRISNGSGGWMTGNTQGTDYNIVHAVQLNNVHAVPGMTIAWNQVINQPGNSRVEDNISVYQSSGTSSSPILIHDNYIEGAYTIDPTNAQGGNWGYAGTGINLGDGTIGDTPSTCTSYVQGYNNIVVSTCNAGIVIEAGNNVSMTNNTIVFSGQLANGATLYQKAGDGNVGVIIWNEYPQPGTVFFNNSGSGNTIGYVYPPDTNPYTGRNDSWTPDAASWTGNTSMPNPVTYANETAQWTAWQNKLIANGQTVGPMT